MGPPPDPAVISTSPRWRWVRDFRPTLRIASMKLVVPPMSVLAALFLLVLAVPTAHAASLTIAPAETTVTIGDSFTLRVVIDAVPDLKGADLIYGYTPARLTFTSAQVGDALTGLGGAIFDTVLPDVTAPPDSVWYDAARLTGTGSGPGVVAFLEFGTHSQGNATVNCLFIDLRDSANAPLSSSCAGALIHVIGPVPVRPTTWGRVKAHYR